MSTAHPPDDQGGEVEPLPRPIENLPDPIVYRSKRRRPAEADDERPGDGDPPEGRG